MGAGAGGAVGLVPAGARKWAQRLGEWNIEKGAAAG